jgi:hypothetical protein
MRIEHTDSVIERFTRWHREAHVVEPDAILVKAIALSGARGKGKGADAEAHRAVAEKRTRVEIHELAEVEDSCVERD